MPSHLPINEALDAPNGSLVRLAAGGVVFTDLGPAMGRTTAFPHRILANVPSIRNAVERRMVGNREGYVLPVDGVVRLLEVLAKTRSKTDANADALSEFLDWARNRLVPELQARFGQAQPIPCKVCIQTEGLDLRMDLADLRLLRIELERPGQPKVAVQGDGLLKTN